MASTSGWPNGWSAKVAPVTPDDSKRRRMAEALLANAQSPAERAWAERMLLNPDDPAQDPIAHKGLPPSVTGIVKSILTMPQRSFDASQEFGAAYNEGRDVSPEAAGTVLEVVGTLAGGGMARQAIKGPAATAGELGIFGGRLAKNAPVDDLIKAQALEEAGKSADDIWRATGWGRGADGEWRFEIDDSGAEFRGINPEPQQTPMRAALKHPDLYGNYPDFVPFTVREQTMGDAHGRFYGGEGTPEIGVSWSAKDKKSTLLHELQHGVQRQEGFAKGDGGFMLNPGTPAWEIYASIKNKMLTPMTAEDYAKAAGFDSVEEATSSYKIYLRDLKKNAAKYDRQAQETAVQEAYKRSAGEVESRNVQKRMNMSADERRATPPWATEDVPRDQQIVRRGNR
jgi:hypothetical protein